MSEWCANRSEYLKYKEKYNWNEDEPSYFSNDHSNQWYKAWGNGYTYDPFHRTNGPARMWEDGRKEYWLNGIFYESIENDTEWIIKQLLE